MEKDSQALTIITEAYKAAIEYCDGWHNRTWNRFNYLLVIQSALIILYFNSTQAGRSSASIILPLFGIILSLLMYVQGAHDVFSLNRFEYRIEKLKTQILQALDLSEKEYPIPFEKYGEVFKEKQRLARENFLEWRLKGFSTVQVPAIVGLVLLALWIVALLGIIP
jgi:disulfide bond formation protein DsbB